MTEARTVGAVHTHTHTHTSKFIEQAKGNDTFYFDIQMADYAK